jgi:simple sugar transport system permease protein
VNAILAFIALSLIKAAPLAYAALAGVLCERSGIVNIALEGQLAAGAFTGVAVAYKTGNPVAGLFAGIAAGALLGAVLGFAATQFGANQIVAGTGLNLLALGGASYGLVLIFGTAGASPEVPALGTTGEWILIATAFGLAALLHVVLYRTPWGLRVRACGENPRAVASAGIDPRRVRTIATIVGGGLAGLGGVYLSLGELNLYSDQMTAGRGFIGLAAVIFGRWTPLGAGGAALAFGALSALQFILQRTGIPSDLMQTLPYVAVLLALAGIGGRVRAPQSDGVPYVE